MKEWDRLLPTPLTANYSGLFVHASSLEEQGVDPDSLELVAFPELRAASIEPPKTDLVLDVTSAYEIDLVRLISAETGESAYLAGGVFEEPHPDLWLDAIQQRGWAMLIVGRLSVDDVVSPEQWMDTWSTGLVRVGTRIPSK